MNKRRRYKAKRRRKYTRRLIELSQRSTLVAYNKYREAFLKSIALDDNA